MGGHLYVNGNGRLYDRDGLKIDCGCDGSVHHLTTFFYSWAIICVLRYFQVPCHECRFEHC